MNCESNSLGITSRILMTMSKIPALSQKVLAEWLRLPERQELFPGLGGIARDAVATFDFNQLLLISLVEFIHLYPNI